MTLSDFFDQIYVLHLDILVDRKVSIIEQINKYNLKNVTIIDAVNKNEINMDKLKSNELVAYNGNKYCKTAIINDRGDKCWCNGKGHDNVCNYTGRVACAYSHYLAYKDIVEKGYKKCLILEDDFIFIENLNSYFGELRTSIPNDWGVLYFSNSRFINLNNKNHSDVNNYFVKTQVGLSDAGCYGVTYESAKVLNDNLFPIRAAADGYIGVCIDRLYKIKNVYICKKSLSTNGSVLCFKSANDNIEFIKQNLTKKTELNNELKKITIQYNTTNIDTIYTPTMSSKKEEKVSNEKINVLSFCLYGTKATYIIGMKDNIKLAKEHFPKWVVRIYYNSTVPDKYIHEYKELGAECVLCENKGINKMNWEGMFWRWLPLDDKNVNFWVSRDADSRLSKREAGLVEEWMNSGKTLHSIRDHRCHMHCIMGGLFGINNILFHEKYTFQKVTDIIDELYKYYKERPYNVDQIFLNDTLWRVLQDDVIAHISNEGRRVFPTDIEVPSCHNFIGKQYRLADNLVKEHVELELENIPLNTLLKIKSKYNNDCLEVVDNKVLMRNMKDTVNQLWKLDPQYRLISVLNNKYLDIHQKNNDLIVSENKGNNTWKIQSGGFVISNFNEKAIDVKGGLTDRRKEVWAHNLNYSEAQQWDFIISKPVGNFTIKLLSQKMCLGLKDNKVKLVPLSNDKNNLWKFEKNSIMHVEKNLHLDQIKNDLILSHAANSWSIEGNIIKHTTNKVMDVKGGINDQRHEVWLYGLNNSDAQKWELIGEQVEFEEEKISEKTLLILDNKYHHKNKKGMEMICEYLGYDILYGTIADIPKVNVIYSPSRPLNVANYPEKKFIFGPHLSIFPDSKLQQINNKNNSVYIQPSPWARDVWINKDAEKYLPMKSFPFPVETEKFKPTINKSERKNVFVMFKHRKPEELQFVEKHLKEKNIAFRCFRYNGYKEDDYVKYLQTCKYGIWIGRHESQGFALEEALSCDVPLLVWSVTNMRQQHGWTGCPDVPGTTIAFWDERCGEYFENQEDFEKTYETFLNKVDNYKPREFIETTVSVKQCAENFTKIFLNK